MARVELLRTVFWWAGWISLAFAALGIIATLLTFSSQPQSYGAMAPGSFLSQPALMTLMSLPYQLAFPAVLFFAWGVLTMLVEIHQRLEEAIEVLSGDESSDDDAATDGAAPGGLR
jgi:hypothetical protein